MLRTQEKALSVVLFLIRLESMYTMYILQQSIIKINDVLNIHGFCLLTLVVPMYLVVVTKIVFESKSLLLNNNIALFKIIRFMLD